MEDPVIVDAFGEGKPGPSRSTAAGLITVSDQNPGGEHQGYIQVHGVPSPHASEGAVDSNIDSVINGTPPRTRGDACPRERPISEAEWLNQGRIHIRARKEPLSVPFTNVGNEILGDLAKAAKTRGSLKTVLRRMMNIGYKAAVKQAAAKQAENIMMCRDDDTEDSEGGEPEPEPTDLNKMSWNASAP